MFTLIDDGERRLDRTYRRRLVTALYFLALNWSMLAPADDFAAVPDVLPHQDKFVHFGLFLTLAFLVRWSMPAPRRAGWRRFGDFAALLLYAAAIEGLQPLLGGLGRRFDWLDMASNFAGAGCGWLLYGRAGATGLKCAGGPPIIAGQSGGYGAAGDGANDPGDR